MPKNSKLATAKSTANGQKTQKKYRKTSPLTDDQKVERSERLAKARAMKSPSTYKSVHKNVPRDPGTKGNLTDIRKWIKTNKETLAGARAAVKFDPKNTKAREEANMLETYVANLETYLRNGVWLDNRWGENRERKGVMVCRGMAYHWEKNDPFLGMIKRDVGTIYPDVGLWDEEMNLEYYGPKPEYNAPVKYKKQRKVRAKKPAK